MKKLLILVSALIIVFSLAACKAPEDTGITSITLVGVENIEVEQNDVLDLLDGVTAIGSDNVDYSDFITVDSDECTITDGVMDTSGGGVCTVVYSVVVDGKLDRKTADVTVTIPPLPPVEGPTVAEWDFSDEAQLDDWNIYTANGGSIVKSIEDGAMKLVTESGSARYETRLDTQGLPLEQGYPYEMTFKMKSDIAGKKVHVNFGELLPANPYFTPFKTEGIDIITLTTEWQEFTIAFNMELDNQNGGPLFEMGNMDGSVDLDATIWVDDILIVGGSGTDTIAPVISGAEDLTIFIEDGITFDPLEGVTAIDYPDVDLTDNIIVYGDTVDTTVADVYTVVYDVFDSYMNRGHVVRKVTVLNDTEAPVVAGADAVVLTIGTTFDVLDGVTAVDNRDGDVTANIVLGGDVLDVNVAGLYNVTYTITDAAGNENVVTRMITITDMIFDETGLIQNGEFDALAWGAWFGDQWSQYTSSSVSVVNGELVADVSWAEGVTPASYATQVFQEGFAVENGKFYRISFDAYADADKDIFVAFGDALDYDPYFTNYMTKSTVSLTTTLQNFVLEFEMTEVTTVDQGKLVFELATAVETLVYIDNVVVEEIDALGGNPVADTDQVVNGTFDVDNANSWNGWFGDEWSGVTTSSMTAANQVLEVTVEGVTETHASYATQVYQEGFAMVQGETYKLTFVAMAETPRQMNVNLGDALDFDPYFTNYMETFVVDLTADWQEFEVLFTMTEASTLDQGKLVFELGAIDGVAVNTLVKIDNVKIEKLQQAPVLLNGDFETTAWGAWFGDQWSQYTGSTLDLVDGVLVVDVNWAEGVTPAPYATQVYQEGFAVENGKFYRISFDAYADAAKDINVAFGDALDYDPWFTDFMAKTSVSLTTSNQNFVLEFEMTQPTTEDQGKLVFELATAVETVVYIDNVVVEEIDALGGSAVADTNQVVNGTFDQAIEWGAWFGDQWSQYTSSTVEVTNGVLVADVSWAEGVTPATYATQVFQEGLTFRQGVTYTVQFDAYADADKLIKVNVGEPLAYDPYFNYFTDTTEVNLTTTNTTYFITFTMEQVTNENGKLVFELATDVQTVIYIDNVMIYENHN